MKEVIINMLGEASEKELQIVFWFCRRLLKKEE